MDTQKTQFTEKEINDDGFWSKELAAYDTQEKRTKIVITEVDLCIEVHQDNHQTISCLISVEPMSVLDESILDLDGTVIVFNETITEKAIKDAIRNSSYMTKYKDKYIDNPDIVIKKYRIERINEFKKFKDFKEMIVELQSK